MDNQCDESMNYTLTTTLNDLNVDVDIDAILQEEPIKISIYTSDDGQFHMKYDDCGGPLVNSKYKRKSKSNSTSIVKPTTETLYEIDLYCDICHHDYKSLMSLNRHMKTRKHLNQMAKLNETNEQKIIERDWSNYESSLSAYALMPRDVYNSIVQTLLIDHNGNAITPSTADTLKIPATNQIDATDSNYLMYDGFNNHFASTDYQQISDDFHELQNASSVTANDENYTVTNTIQPTVCNDYKCLVCNEQFSTLQLLQEHTQKMRENCATKIDGMHDEFDVEREIQKIDFI